jgi:uncharacterized protein (TIGR02453 family)
MKQKSRGPLPPQTFRFLQDLSRHNAKDWMDAHRDRYRQELVEPMHALLDALAPAIIDLDADFVITGTSGTNFSRINRDIRFARDKTPYHTRMYLMFPDSPSGEGAQLYVGVAARVVTAGFRIYGGTNVKNSPLGRMGLARAASHAAWLAKQRKRLERKYESYWHSMEKGRWTKNYGWPQTPEQWKKLRAWIVRRVMKPSASTRAGFVKDVEHVFKDVLPLARFASSADWKPQRGA